MAGEVHSMVFIKPFISAILPDAVFKIRRTRGNHELDTFSMISIRSHFECLPHCHN